MMETALTDLQRKNKYVADAPIFARAQFCNAAVLYRSSAFNLLAKCYCLRLKSNR